MRVKICGITNIEQGLAIAQFGANALGFICVPTSPRYITPKAISNITSYLRSNITKIGVFANEEVSKIQEIVRITGLTGVQLHGNESPQFCEELRQLLPNIELIKALRIKEPDNLSQALSYTDYVDTLLLDAYDPQVLGGTGKTLNWQMLEEFKPKRPWLLAGGLNPDNILDALSQTQPDGIDLSSGVERSPGDKDLIKVAQLFEVLRQL